MRELWATGWMHNRVRMIAASFLVKDLLISWEEGAAWFWDTLVDADLASNTLGWQWAAGCGADAAPYDRVFNPTRQAVKFDPEGTYVQRWIPEKSSDYPAPCVDHAASRDRALKFFYALRKVKMK
jgi:deoxyribodipyrimidine photo-lyase